MLKILKIITIPLALLLAGPTFAQEYPAQTGSVNDFAGIVSRDASMLQEKISDYKRKVSVDFIIVTASTLDGVTIDDFTMELRKVWGIERDTILIVHAPQERRWRISTGSGRLITDDQATSIGVGTFKEYLQAGEFADGYTAVMHKIVVKIQAAYQKQTTVVSEPEYLISDRSHTQSKSPGLIEKLVESISGIFIAILAFIGAIIAFIVQSLRKKKREREFYTKLPLHSDYFAKVLDMNPQRDTDNLPADFATEYQDQREQFDAKLNEASDHSEIATQQIQEGNPEEAIAALDLSDGFIAEAENIAIEMGEIDTRMQAAFDAATFAVSECGTEIDTAHASLTTLQNLKYTLPAEVQMLERFRLQHAELNKLCEKNPTGTRSDKTQQITATTKSLHVKAIRLSADLIALKEVSERIDSNRDDFYGAQSDLRSTIEKLTQEGYFIGENEGHEVAFEKRYVALSDDILESLSSPTLAQSKQILEDFDTLTGEVRILEHKLLVLEALRAENDTRISTLEVSVKELIQDISDKRSNHMSIHYSSQGRSWNGQLQKLVRIVSDSNLQHRLQSAKDDNAMSTQDFSRASQKLQEVERSITAAKEIIDELDVKHIEIRRISKNYASTYAELASVVQKAHDKMMDSDVGREAKKLSEDARSAFNELPDPSALSFANINWLDLSDSCDSIQEKASSAYTKARNDILEAERVEQERLQAIEDEKQRIIDDAARVKREAREAERQRLQDIEDAENAAKQARQDQIDRDNKAQERAAQAATAAAAAASTSSFGSDDDDDDGGDDYYSSSSNDDDDDGGDDYYSSSSNDDDDDGGASGSY